MDNENGREDRLTAHLRAETEAAMVIDVAQHLSERLHEVVKLHAMTMPTVSAAIGLGLLTAQQIYAETLAFATNSMDGDSSDAEAICDAAGVLMRELLDVIDIPEMTDWSNAKRAETPNSSPETPTNG